MTIDYGDVKLDLPFASQDLLSKALDTFVVARMTEWTKPEDKGGRDVKELVNEIAAMYAEVSDGEVS